MTDGPARPLTFTERMICDCLARGWSYKRTAQECQITRATVKVHVSNIARKLPVTEDVGPYQRVFLWLQHRNWLVARQSEAA